MYCCNAVLQGPVLFGDPLLVRCGPHDSLAAVRARVQVGLRCGGFFFCLSCKQASKLVSSHWSGTQQACWGWVRHCGNTGRRGRVGAHPVHSLGEGQDISRGWRAGLLLSGHRSHMSN
jgi:hypothetical protein